VTCSQGSQAEHGAQPGTLPDPLGTSDSSPMKVVNKKILPQSGPQVTQCPHPVSLFACLAGH
jgi:hypothetical protein